MAYCLHGHYYDDENYVECPVCNDNRKKINTKNKNETISIFRYDLKNKNDKTLHYDHGRFSSNKKIK